MTIEQIETELLKLASDERARLAEMLLSSLDHDGDVKQAWFDEIDRRYQGYLAGSVDSIPAEQAMGDAYAMLKK